MSDSFLTGGDAAVGYVPGHTYDLVPKRSTSCGRLSLTILFSRSLQTVFVSFRHN
jgi:hypothetical protein